MIRAGSLMYGRWLAQYSPKTVESKTVDKTTCTWPFRAKNRYNVTLANHRAPCVWFVVGFRMYLFLAPKWPDIPVFGKILDSHIGRTNTSVRRTCGECHSSLTDHPPPPGWGGVGQHSRQKTWPKNNVSRNGRYFFCDWFRCRLSRTIDSGAMHRQPS